MGTAFPYHIVLLSIYSRNSCLIHYYLKSAFPSTNYMCVYDPQLLSHGTIGLFVDRQIYDRDVAMTKGDTDGKV